jgi:uncharacterized protein (TIGR02118 family)
MIKRITLAKRRPDMTHQQFAEYWLGPHVEVARGIPRALGYVINVADDPDAAGWDGVAEMWFESREDARDAFASEYRIFLTEEHVISPPPR